MKSLAITLLMIKMQQHTIFSLLTGWGLNKAETGEWEQTEKLKLKTLQVSPKSLCAFRFSREELKKKGVSFFQIKRQLTVGFTNDVSCVGNDFKEKVYVIFFRDSL